MESRVKQVPIFHASGHPSNRANFNPSPTTNLLPAFKVAANTSHSHYFTYVLRAVGILFAAFQVAAADVDDLDYVVGSTFVTISDCDPQAAGNLVIPGSIEGKPVREIGATAFEGCDKIKSITIPNTVWSLGNQAFKDCTTLSNLIFEGNAPSVGSQVFLNIGPDPLAVAFYGSDGFNEDIGGIRVLLSADFSNLTFTTSGDTATITHCANSVSGRLFIPPYLGGATVRIIAPSAFLGCFSLTGITMPNTITNIGTSAFQSCRILETINLPEGITEISAKQFASCQLLTNLQIPSTVNSIGASAFQACFRITEFNLPNALTNIGPNAFRDCTRITRIQIPKSVSTINSGAFAGCEGLTNILVMQENLN